MRVTSYLKSGTMFNGAAVVVVKNPPQELIDKLTAEVEKFEPTSRLTCSKASCHHLGIKKNIYTPKQLLELFMKIKNEGQLDIDVYTLNSREMAEVKNGFKKRVNLALVNFVGIATTIAVPFVLSIFEKL